MRRADIHQHFWPEGLLSSLARQLWAGLVLADPSPERVDALLDQGAAGVCLPAAAVASRKGLETLGPAIERLGSRGAPLFIHPGPLTPRTAHRGGRR